MPPFRQVADFAELAGLDRELHLAIGVFDGVHLGHRTVIESAVLAARRNAGLAAVLTFDPHPSRLFRPQEPTRMLLPIEAKVRLLHELGVDVVIVKRFDAGFAAIEADNFAAHLKGALPTLHAVYIGENFRFGKRRAGDVGLLVRTGRDLGLHVYSVDRLRHNGEPVSSTRIRAAVESGAVAEVNEMLGYNYFARGPVVTGAGLGRKLGYPTLNVDWDPECRPRFGVYFVRIRSLEANGSGAAAVANYGVRPTVSGAGAPHLEVHVLAETTLGPGDRVEVEWLAFIRPEQRFDSTEALKEQIAIDRERAAELAGRAP